MKPKKRLTSAQARAVSLPPNKHAVVVAVAGAGKTTVLEQRIRTLIAAGYVNILAVTFTKKAATNIEQRLNTVPDTLFIGTFHSFCYRTLTDLSPERDAKQFITEANEFRLFTWAEGVIKRNAYPFDAKSVISNTQLLFKKGVPAHEWQKLEDNKILNTASYQLLEEVHNAGFQFFDELPLDLLLLLRDDRDKCARLAAKYPVILVDEFQDTDDVQAALLQLLTAHGSVLFVVGDPSQSIYTWRGCNPQIIEQFTNYFGDAEHVVLDTNFRSKDNILTLGNKLLTNMSAKESMTGVRGTSEEAVSIVRYSNPVAEAAAIADKLAKYDRHNDTAILYRSNSQSGALESELAKVNIPFVVSGKARSFFDLPEIATILRYLRLSIDPYDLDSLRYVWNRPSRFLKTDWLTQAVGGLTNPKALDAVRAVNARKAKGAAQQKGIDALLSFLAQANKPTNPVEAIYDIMRRFRYDAYIRDLADKSLSRNIDDLKLAISQIIDIAKDYTSIKAFLTHVQFVVSLQQQKQAAKPGVMLSTIHSAKGLEFAKVYLIGAEDGMLPHENSSNIEEEHRLAYVAVTRAEDELHISYYERLSRFFVE